MSNQLFTDGDTIEVNGEKLECVLVQYRERDGEKENFVYGFRSHSEVEAEREETRKAEEDTEKARQEQADQEARENSEQINNEGTEA